MSKDSLFAHALVVPGEPGDELIPQVLSLGDHDIDQLVPVHLKQSHRDHVSQLDRYLLHQCVVHGHLCLVLLKRVLFCQELVHFFLCLRRNTNNNKIFGFPCFFFFKFALLLLLWFAKCVYFKPYKVLTSPLIR